MAEIDGETVFVHGALPEERVRVQPVRRRRKIIEADLLEVLEASPARVQPGCEYFGTCGGCALQHLSAAEQFERKTRGMVETLRRIGGVRPIEVQPGIESAPWGYRRRARVGVRFVPKKGRVLVGFRERSAPFVTDMTHCPVLAAPADRCLGSLAETLMALTIRDKVPQVELAIGDDCAALVLRVLVPPKPEDRQLLMDFGSRWGVDLYLQPGGLDSLQPLGPSRTLSYRLPEFGLDMTFGPVDFIQVNGPVNQSMVSKAVELLDVGPGERVLDLFCGLGNFSLALATRAGEVLGLEGDDALTDRAAANAARNGVENAEFRSTDLSRTDGSPARQRWELVLLDPPRTGAAAVIDSMAAIRPRRILYVSCHPGTLARDAAALIALSYRLKTVVPVDMFPQTHHVETMALFEAV